MSKLYVFGIGGTGSRVLKSLTMLLAAGVDCKADTVVPIIIDLDAPGGDVARNTRFISNYAKIRERAVKSFDRGNGWQNRFFETRLKTDNLHLPLTEKGVSFGEYIGETPSENVKDIPLLNQENKALAKVLFSNDNLTTTMQEGFYGNPNIGSVVLNQFDTTKEYLNLFSDFGTDDKIFIISSIFGGTGASGFPLLLKTLRESENQNVSKAHIGAIAVLPYFAVKKDPNSKIDSDTFASKAKAALAYYDRCISKENGIDALYYIAENNPTIYKNNPGGAKQENKTHFVELAAALSILDFATSNKGSKTVYKEYGIANSSNSNQILFNDLGDKTKNLLQKPLTQFLLFAKYLQSVKVEDFKKKVWFKQKVKTTSGKPRFEEKFFHSTGDDFVKTFKDFQKDYTDWLAELEDSDHSRKFSPFELNKDENLMELIRGIKIEKGRFGGKKSFDYDNIDSALNVANDEQDIPAVEPAPQLVELFYRATQNLVKEKFNIG